WLREALVRGVLGDASYGASTEPETRAAAARALASVAEKENDEVLAAWASTQVARFDANDSRATAVERSEAAQPVLSKRDEEIALASRALESSSEGGRVQALEQLVSLLRSAPAYSNELCTAIVELSRARSDDELIFIDALRIADRVADFASVGRLCRER